MIYLSQSAYAKLHGVSKQLVGRWIKAGRLPVFNFAGIVRVNKATPRPKKKRAGRIPNAMKIDLQ
jgi:predicted site-specific integrase-resolvase